jgi:hypothetical protein
MFFSRSGSGAHGGRLYVDDVFSAFKYAGNSSTQSIVNGKDLAGFGGMVHLKSRSATTDNLLFHTARGATKELRTNSSGAETTDADTLTAFNSNGFSLGADSDTNNSGATYIAHAFRNAPKFYDHEVVVKSGADVAVSFSDLAVLGMVRVKSLSSTGTDSWYVWHRSLGTGDLLIGETTAAASSMGYITVSGTTVTLEHGILADGTYLVEAWAHDTGDDGMIQCGSFVIDGGGNGTASLGWEPQLLLYKRSDSSGSWVIVDASRAFVATAGSSAGIFLNSTAAESATLNATPTADGFTIGGQTASAVFQFMAVRRPNKPPTAGTEVYNAAAYTGNGGANSITGIGFAPDAVLGGRRNQFDEGTFSRLRGGSRCLVTSSNVAEAGTTNDLTTFDMDGFTLAANSNASLNTSAQAIIAWCLKRAPGVFDEVCFATSSGVYTGPHNLGAIPELLIFKSRSGTSNWRMVSAYLTSAAYFLNLNSDAAEFNNVFTNYTATDTDFSIPNAGFLPTTADCVGMFFATLAGISKVGMYTGNGSTQTINCGFAAGARLFFVKRIDSTGDEYIWDSTRGIVSGNDPQLSLNVVSDTEATGDDSVDPDASGIIVNQNGTTNINVNSARYLFLAIA